jgi:hypothetical protein
LVQPYANRSNGIPHKKAPRYKDSRIEHKHFVVYRSNIKQKIILLLAAVFGLLSNPHQSVLNLKVLLLYHRLNKQHQTKLGL